MFQAGTLADEHKQNKINEKITVDSRYPDN